jgi:hypothetical protein
MRDEPKLCAYALGSLRPDQSVEYGIGASLIRRPRQAGRYKGRINAPSPDHGLSGDRQARIYGERWCHALELTLGTGHAKRAHPFGEPFRTGLGTANDAGASFGCREQELACLACMDEIQKALLDHVRAEQDLVGQTGFRFT